MVAHMVELRSRKSSDSDPEAERTEASAPGSPPTLAVSEHALGRGVANHWAIDATDRFEEGSAVFFFTRVIGGADGGQIRHVWIRDGRVVQAIELSLGGAHWRTHSRKTIYGLGSWAVEARDMEDRVLARAEFACVPRR